MSTLDFLIDWTLRGSALLAAGLIGCALLRRRSAALRHALLATAMLGVFATALLSALPGQMNIEVAWLKPKLVAALPVNMELAPPKAAALTPRASTEEPLSMAMVPAQSWRPPSIPALLVLAWGLIALALLLRPVLGQRLLSRLLRRPNPEERGLQREIDAVRQQIDLRPMVKLRLADGGDSPLVFGLLRPTLVLPKDARSWDPERRRAVLLHELSHLRRRDLWWQWLARAMVAAQWFNPLAWIVAQRLRLESEQATDDCVLQCGCTAQTYARDLLALSSGSKSAAGTLLMARRHGLERRLRAILSGDRRRDAPGRMVRSALLALVACVAAPLAMVEFVPMAIAEEGEKPPAEEPPTEETPAASVEIEAESTDYSHETSIASSKGNVTMRYGDVVIHADSVEYHTKTAKILAEGNVRLHYTHAPIPFIVAKGQTLVYEIEAQRIQISGGIELVKGHKRTTSDIASATKLEINLEDGSAKVLGRSQTKIDQGTGDQANAYLTAYLKMQDAQKLETTGELSKTLSAYIEAAGMFRAIAQDADWKPEMVGYRRRHLQGSIDRVAGKIADSAAYEDPGTRCQRCHEMRKSADLLLGGGDHPLAKVLYNHALSAFKELAVQKQEPGLNEHAIREVDEIKKRLKEIETKR